MITQLATLKNRLGLAESDIKDDALLTRAIEAIGFRFVHECHRWLARCVDTPHEFAADAVEVSVRCYPIEQVSRFELKRDETEGWVEVAAARYLLRGGSVISLERPLGSACEQGRVIYTGGYVLPGEAPVPGAAALPADLEWAAVEQVAFWYENRNRQGLSRIWDYHSTYRHFGALDLLPGVTAVLQKHARCTLD